MYFYTFNIQNMSEENHRNSNLLNIRPDIPAALVNENTSPEERFQNLTLRPIIKFQHPLLVAIFRQYIIRTKTKFSEFSDHQHVVFIERTFQKDTSFKNELKGIIIGQMTVEEYQIYTQNTATFNKRITGMLAQRMKDSIPELL